MSNFLSRLKVESEDLELRLEKLTKFNKTKPFYELCIDDQGDLTEQLYCMSQLSGILRTRIAKAEGYYSGYKQTLEAPVNVGCTQTLISPSN